MTKRIYLDYAASTPVEPSVEQAMRPYFLQKFGNPGSLHSFGQEAIAAVDGSREKIARAIGADFREIIFTGSATEANNLALRGALRRFTQMNADKNISDHQRHIGVHQRPRLVISAVEHESVLETARDLENDGVEVVYIPVDRRGVVDLEKLREALNDRTVLVSVMYANNEIGVVQPIREIVKIISDFKNSARINNHDRSQSTNERESTNKRFVDSDKFVVSHRYPLFHTDAAQAFQFLDCNVSALGVDLMTFSAHKIYGPKGIGALYVRNSKHEAPNSKQIQNSKSPNASNFDIRISDLPAVAPLVTGGGQEFGLRSGTENVSLIVGFAKAAELLFSNSRELENRRIRGLRDYFWRGLHEVCPRAQKNADFYAEKRGKFPRDSTFLPNILNAYFPKHEAQFLLTKLDLAGVAASSGSACRSRAMESSYVTEALGYDKERAKHSVRFSFGRPTTKGEINEALKVIKNSL